MLNTIKTLPKAVASQMSKVYKEMTEAKQNCEGIAFRGHRLLDQVRGGTGGGGLEQEETWYTP